MDRHDLIAARLAGLDDGRGQHTVFFHALGGLLHRIIIPHFERVVGRRVQLRQGNGDDHLSLGLGRGGRGLLHLGRSARRLGGSAVDILVSSFSDRQETEKGRMWPRPIFSF